MRTKILATIGPASSSREVLSALMASGVRIFRLNFSHGGASSFVNLIARLRDLEREYGSPITIMQDLSGPKIRIGEIAEGSIELAKGQQLIIGPTPDGLPPDNTRPFVPFTHMAILNELEIGDRLVLSDGGLQFLVTDTVCKDCYELTAQNDGIITSRKGLALPGKSIKVPALTEKDKKDLVDGLNLGVDAVALSYVQTPEDILEAKAIIKAQGKDIPVVAKLERQNAVDRLEEILAVVDVIMVARGDLGVECPLPLLPGMQKRIIRACNKASKPVIIATQMLLSMVNSPSPTRAETTDVANAVLDGADCVMLSEETAMGNFPVQTVDFMTQIAIKAEELYFEMRKAPVDESSTVSEFLAYSACLMAEKSDAKAIAAHSLSGSAARLLSAERPKHTVYGLTPNRSSISYLNFSWGVTPVLIADDDRAHLERVQDFVDGNSAFEKGDQVVITAGQPKAGDPPSGTNLIKIYNK